MDGDRFDSMTKAAMVGGRRAALRNLGLFAAGLTALLGAREVDAKERNAKGHKRTTGPKKRRQGRAGAEAQPEIPGGPLQECCARCPATGNECTIAVRDASTGRCEQIAKRSGLPCGTRGTCGSDALCHECDYTLCPSISDPTGETKECVDLDHESNYCGSCDKQCDISNQESCCFGQCCPQGNQCFCDGPPSAENCSCQSLPEPWPGP
jgi:hypothetical protein